MNFMIRVMVKEDIRKVQDVANKSWKSTYKGIIPLQVQENFLNAAYNYEMMESRLNDTLMLVAETDDKIVGFANFTPVNSEGQSELSAIYLNQDYQGEGIGTALLRRGIQKLLPLKELYIDVEKDNTIGKRFYDAKGFMTIKEYDDNFDGHILKTVRMCLTV